MSGSRDQDMNEERQVLSSIPLNTPQRFPMSSNAEAGPSKFTPTTTNTSKTITPSSSSTRKLAPIFLTKRKSPNSINKRNQNQTDQDVTNIENQDPQFSPSMSSLNGSPISRKRIKLDSGVLPLSSISLEPSSSSSSSSSTLSSLGDGFMYGISGNTTLREGGLDIEVDCQTTTKNHVRMHSIHDWFLPSTTNNYERIKDGKKPEIIQRDQFSANIPVNNAETPGIWKRQRKRLGLKGINCSIMEKQKLITPQTPYLSTLVHSLLPYHPTTPPSILLLPSIHPPTGRPRDFAPPLSIAFNNIAKTYDSTTSKDSGLRRLIAVAGEEGGVRILDVDEGLGQHPEEKGFWWRAHGNAIFDMKWSRDDSRVLTASGDQSTRLHALTTPTPTLLATLKGHTSSVKTTVFFDPSRSHSDPSVSSSVIASSGRDGNILIYDIRCRGKQDRDLNLNMAIPRGDRERYSNGVPGFVAQNPNRGMELNPVMTIKNAHGDGKKNGTSRTATRSVTSLVALQSMPGILASGGSFDGIVKLWDLRFPAPTTRSPEPRPSCTSLGSLPDPTTYGSTPARRARSINALCESPATGDLYALCGDSKIHSLRPSSMLYSSSNLVNEERSRHSVFLDNDDKEREFNLRETIGIKTYTDPNLLVSSFYIKLSISPDGKHLSSGSCKGGLMTWDINSKINDKATNRLSLAQGGVTWPQNKEREIGAVDWAKDMLAASSDDLATRIWRSNRDAAKWLEDDPIKAGEEWAGSI
ncbi:uncharacterized protein L201_000360 [Kwoniella dendrophila CBS 6074]|uniref:WD40 repeat-like protein n=1 Tax=Kwoniella dendrophila CBS 6074 TaxID=1295534 RepID=A0AAX4JJ83_9TREE